MFEEFISTDDIHENYLFREVLGEYKFGKVRGAFAEVRKAIYIEEDKQVAIKCIDKKRIGVDDLKIFQNQCEIMLYVQFRDSIGKLEHPNIVEVYEVYDNADYFYIVMEFMAGGELYDKKNLHRCQSEAQICQIVRTITDALDFCHSKNIVHRDIKPENILWSTNDKEAILKIADFGFAKISNDSLMTTACGTPMFFSPEILRGQAYTKSVDFWSLGIITYILLCGKNPFDAETEDEVFMKIKEGKVDFPDQIWKYISTSAKQFIRGMLEKIPRKRLKADDIRSHPWINADHTDNVAYAQRSENILNFETERKIQKVRNIIGLTLIDIRNDNIDIEFNHSIA